ncbi:MAG: hypothetical protein U0414_19215 [Polyangiaceae bacterium]
MRGDEAVDALRRDDLEALGKASLGADVPSAIEAALPILGKRARLLATSLLPAIGGAPAGRALLALSGDADPLVASSAARALAALPVDALPDAAFLTHSIAVRRNAKVRATLYGVVARTGDRAVLPRLRGLYDQERDPDALASAHRAAARLGSVEERRAFAAGLARAQPGHVLELEDHLVAFGEPRMMRAASTWFDDARFVVSAGNHGREVPIRVCDVAARAAARLGVAFDGNDTSLRPRSSSEIASAKAATLALPALVDAETVLRAEPARAPAAPPPAHEGPLVRLDRPKEPPKVTELPTAEAALPTITNVSSLPFVAPSGAAPGRPARPKPRFDTGTQDLEKAKAEAMAGHPSTPFRAPSPTRPPAEAAQPSIGFEQYTWVCALEARSAAAAARARADYGISEGAWRDVHARWQTWLGGDVERWRRFQTLLEEYQRRGR